MVSLADLSQRAALKLLESVLRTAGSDLTKMLKVGFVFTHRVQELTLGSATSSSLI